MPDLQLNQHISQHFNEDLERLRKQFLDMGGLVEVQVADAVRALETADSALAQKVLTTEKEVDRRESDLDAAATLLIARRHPAATDLRLVLAIIRGVHDLERIGDEAKKIAKMALAVNDDGFAPRGYTELRHMASGVLKMINQALDAFARFDVDTARTVMRDDPAIDREYKTAVRELVTYMMEDPRSISRVMNILWALRALERIGDHAGNIAEHIIYLVHGMDVRHMALDAMEEALDKKNGKL